MQQCDDSRKNDPDLREFLRLLGPGDVVVGIGNTLRGDDGFGPELVAQLSGSSRCAVIDGGEMPEDCGGQILEKHPGRILFADAVAFGGAPGELVLLGPDQLGQKVAVSTHNLPLVMFIRYLGERLPDAEIRILGVQPRQIDLGKGLSPEVAKTVQVLKALLSA
jgi:hydrogenase 3 maturation protease